MKLTIILIMLLLFFVTNAEAQLRRNIFVMSNAVSCAEGKQIVASAVRRFAKQGIAFQPTVKCVAYNRLYALGDEKKQLTDLKKQFGGKKVHFIVPPFVSGNKLYFSGLASRINPSSKDSLYTAKPNRLINSTNGLMHEIGHTLYAMHDFSNANIMGYNESFETSFNPKALEQMRIGLRVER